jgi:hypothetical protein
MKKTLIFFVFALLLQFSAFAQYRNHTWLFGDSILFRFDPITNIPSVSVGNGRTAAMSAVLCDEAGNIDLYTNGWNLYNHLNEYTPNGISYHGLNYGPINPFLSNFGTVTDYRDKGVFFIPSSINDSIYYLYQLLYRDTIKTFKIDLTADNGKGDISYISKIHNSPTFNYGNNDGKCQIKHGNGRDWWVYSTEYQNGDQIDGVWNQNRMIKFLVQDSFISSPIVIDIDTNYNFSNPTFFSTTLLNDKICVTTFTGLIFLTKMNRCSGELFDSFFVQRNYLYDSQVWCNAFQNASCFSPSGRFLYTCNFDTIFQYDTQSWNVQDILNGRQVIYTDPNPAFYDSLFGDCVYPSGWGFRGMRLGPDGKIYIGSPYMNSAPNATGPPDTIGDFNTHLSTIEFPDSAGTACNFQLWSVPLGRVYYDGLGSAPNYYLGPLENSPCDTLLTTGLSELNPTSQITLAPNPAQTQATLKWLGVAEGSFVLRDMLGRTALQQEITASSGSIKLDLSALPKGIYLWQVQSAGYSNNGKLVVE